jgi:5-methyltetrahydropteroyltriglutamate--homocysteine methyltransferase
MLQTAVRKHAAVGSFMSAASPGVTGYFFRNEYYPDHESYLFALAAALRHEYEAIVNAGVMLQIECICAGETTRARTTATSRSRRSWI